MSKWKTLWAELTLYPCVHHVLLQPLCIVAFLTSVHIIMFHTLHMIMSIQVYIRAAYFAKWIKHTSVCSLLLIFWFFHCFAGTPPATGTGTLIIYLEDYNDNAPYVVPSVAQVCEDAHDMNVAIVGGWDKDLPPNAAPFKIELGKQPGLDKTWKVTRVNCEYLIFEGNMCALKWNLAVLDIKLEFNHRLFSVKRNHS